MNLTEQIKAYALQIGYAKVGVTNMDSLTFFEDEIKTRGHNYDAWHFETDPKKVYPEGKSIIVMAYDYAQTSFPKELKQYMGRAYLSRSYKPLPESIHGARLNLMEKFLEEKGMQYYRMANEMPIRQLAARAGVTSFGRNNFAYVDGVGSFVILYGFIVDQVLDYDEPSLKCKCPPDCRKCLDACPTCAIEAPFKLNPTKCIGYNNWMRRKEGDAILDTTIPEEIRGDLGIKIHGCDACQEVCPRNQGKIINENKYPKDRFLETLKDKINLHDLLMMEGDYYEENIYPIMYNYITDKKIFQRNAAIAMGNTGDEAYVEDLKKAIEFDDECVRLHAAWALEQIHSKKA